MNSKLLVACALLTLTSAFWSLNSVIGRAVRDDISAVGLSFWRWTLPVVLIAPFVIGEVRREWPAIRRSWRLLVVLGLIGTAVQSAASFYALKFTVALHLQIFNSIVPLGVMLFAWIGFGTRPSRSEAVGFLVSLAGVLAIVSHGDPMRLVRLEFNKGDIIALAALLVWGVNTTLLKNRPQELSVWAFTFLASLIGVLALLPAYLWEIATERPSLAYTPLVWGGIVYMGIFGSLVGNAFLSIGVDRLGSARASLFSHLVPVWGAVFSTLFLAEGLGLYQVIGFALVLAGLAICNQIRLGPARA